MARLIPPTFDEADAPTPLEAPRWYAVFTNARCEKRAALSIMDALKVADTHHDLGVYLPVETYWVRHARRREPATRALLPRYVFVCIREEHMHLVRASDGVEDFVRSGGVPRPVNLYSFSNLQAREQSGEFDSTRSDETEGPFKPDERVEVKLGKFTGWPGKVVKMTGAEKVRVLLSMFGKEHEKELDVSELRAA